MAEPESKHSEVKTADPKIPDNKSPDAKSAEAKTGAKPVASGATETQQSDAGESSDDAVAMLKNDHRKVEQIFEAFEKAERRAQKQKLARDICNELVVHALLEEEIFYPACREHMDDSMLDEAQVEHDSAKILINELLSGRPSDEYYDAKVKVLSEMIKHHVGEEEKRAEGIFAKAKAAGVDTDDIARRMVQRKQELMADIGSQTLERPQPRSFTAQSGARQPGDSSRMEESMPRYDDDENERRGSSRRSSQTPERDSQGRFMSDDDRGGRGGSGSSSRSRDDDDDRRSSRSRTPERDSDGRFMSDDDRGSRSRSNYDDDNRSSRGRSREDDDRRGASSASNRDDDEDDRRSPARSRSRDDDDDDRRTSTRGRSRDDDNDDRGGRSASSRSRTGGWFGDPEGHAEASRRGWESSDHEGSGWYGDSEGHSEAARRGAQNRTSSRDDDDRGRSRSREDDDDRRSSRQSSSRSSGNGGGRSSGNASGNGGGRGRDDDDRRSSRASSSRSSGSSSSGSSHGGWFGDSEGHAEAARRGRENRG